MSAVIPGDSAHSQLMLRVSSREAGRRMPPSGELLTAEEVGSLQHWIDQGAEWPESGVGTPSGSPGNAATTTDHPHWAFRRLRSVKPPGVKDNSWAKTPVDQFILAAGSWWAASKWHG